MALHAGVPAKGHAAGGTGVGARDVNVGKVSLHLFLAVKAALAVGHLAGDGTFVGPGVRAAVSEEASRVAEGRATR